jgi:hypothetical protein
MHKDFLNDGGAGTLARAVSKLSCDSWFFGRNKVFS